MAANGYRGRFLWYELLTPDPDDAADFYTDIVGWGTQDWEGGETPYRMWTNGETPLGGTMQLPDEAVEQGAPPHWLPYVGTPDVDATAERAEELGGRVIVQPNDIPSVGRFAVLADPQGAVFAVYTPEGEPPGHEGPPQEGEFSWHELATTDWRAAFDFYHDLFGWEKTEAMDMGEMGTYQMYGRAGMPLGGMFDKPDEMPGPPTWLCYAKVPDVHAAAERVEARGGRILNGPMEVPGGDWIVQCMDRQGAPFALHSAAGGDGS